MLRIFTPVSKALAMKKALLILVLTACYVQGSLAETLSSLEPSPIPVRERHLDHFISLFEQFCLDQNSQQSALKKLVDSKRFRPADGYEGVYEEYFDRLSYAVTPDQDACTVDVLLEHEEGKLLLALEEVQNAVLGSTHYQLFKEASKTEEGPNSEQVLTVERTYHLKGSEKKSIVLSYPTTHQNVFFMTLDYHYE